MTQAKSSSVVVIACVLFSIPGIAVAEDVTNQSETRLVDCDRGDSIQNALGRKNPDRPLKLFIRGACHGDVTITRDDVTLVSEPARSASLNGGISVVGARRVLISGLIVTNSSGDGIFANDNAAITVEDSTIQRNGQEGVHIRNGAHANLNRNIISGNGVARVADTGRGIQATHNGSVDARNNTIVDNTSDGIGIFNGSYARLVENTVERNGRVAAGESGIQVSRSRVRADGNIIRNNTGASAVAVVNHGDYRTGTALNPLELRDNQFAFEVIEHPVGLVGTTNLLAIDVNNASYGDFRQVDIVGSVSVGAMSMLHLRGDDVAPSLRCSTVNITGGFFSVSGRNGLARLRATNVTPPAVGVGGPNGQLDGPVICGS